MPSYSMSLPAPRWLGGYCAPQSPWPFAWRLDRPRFPPGVRPCKWLRATLFSVGRQSRVPDQSFALQREQSVADVSRYRNRTQTSVSHPRAPRAASAESGLTPRFQRISCVAGSRRSNAPSRSFLKHSCVPHLHTQYTFRIDGAASLKGPRWTAVRDFEHPILACSRRAHPSSAAWRYLVQRHRCVECLLHQSEYGRSPPNTVSEASSSIRAALAAKHGFDIGSHRLRKQLRDANRWT